jgi:Uma2 family endonuclease
MVCSFGTTRCARKRVRLIAREGRPDEYLELVGSPDWVLEIVSRSSINKDEHLLRAAYHRARVEEYWLITRSGPASVRPLEYRPGDYEEVKPVRGWRESPVFGRQFRPHARAMIGWDCAGTR